MQVLSATSSESTGSADELSADESVDSDIAAEPEEAQIQQPIPEVNAPESVDDVLLPLSDDVTYEAVCSFIAFTRQRAEIIPDLQFSVSADEIGSPETQRSSGTFEMIEYVLPGEQIGDVLSEVSTPEEMIVTSEYVGHQRDAASPMQEQMLARQVTESTDGADMVSETESEIEILMTEDSEEVLPAMRTHVVLSSYVPYCRAVVKRRSSLVGQDAIQPDLSSESSTAYREHSNSSLLTLQSIYDAIVTTSTTMTVMRSDSSPYISQQVLVADRLAEQMRVDIGSFIKSGSSFGSSATEGADADSIDSGSELEFERVNREKEQAEKRTKASKSAKPPAVPKRPVKLLRSAEQSLDMDTSKTSSTSKSSLTRFRSKEHSLDRQQSRSSSRSSSRVRIVSKFAEVFSEPMIDEGILQSLEPDERTELQAVAALQESPEVGRRNDYGSKIVPMLRTVYVDTFC